MTSLLCQSGLICWLGLLLYACLLGTCVAASDIQGEWSSGLAASLHDRVPRYAKDFTPASHDFRPTHSEYQQSLLGLALVAIVACALVVTCSGCFSCVLSRVLWSSRRRTQTSRTTRKPQHNWRRLFWVADSATAVLTLLALLLGLALSSISLQLSRDVDNTLQPVQARLQGDVTSALATAHGLLADSKMAYPSVVHLRDLALSLAPQVEQLHSHVQQMLDLLTHYSQAKELDNKLDQLAGASVRDLPQVFPRIRSLLEMLDRSLLTPIQAPLAAMNAEITSLEEVVRIDSIKELQFGLFFFLSLETSLLSDSRYDHALVQWMEAKEREVRTDLLAYEMRVVQAALHNRTTYSSSVHDQAQHILATYLLEGRAIEAIPSVEALLRTLSVGSIQVHNGENLNRAMRDLSGALHQKLADAVPLEEAKKLKNGIAFLEDRASIERIRSGLVEHQFGEFQEKLRLVASKRVDNLLRKWSTLNDAFTTHVNDTEKRWASYSVRMHDIRGDVDKYLSLWLVYVHGSVAVLLLVLFVACLAFFFPRFLWVALVLLLAAALWCGLEAGVYLPTVVATSDWCVAPEAAIISLVRENTSVDKQLARIDLGGISQQLGYHTTRQEEHIALEGVVQYYTDCRGDNLLAHPLAYISQELQEATSQLDQLMNYTLIVPSAKNATMELRGALVDSQARIGRAWTLTDCRTIQTPFAQANSSVCGELLRESFVLLIGRVLMVLLISLAFLSAWLGIAVHSQHAQVVATGVPLIWLESGEVEYHLLLPTASADAEPCYQGTEVNP